MKKVISIVLSICMLFSITAGLDINVFAKDLPSSGICGENLTYTYTNSNGKSVLTISGTGDMYNYGTNGYNDVSNSPFQKTDITNIVINSGVTSIGNYAFCECSKLTSVSFADTVIKIGNNAFKFCNNIKSITIPDSVKTIGDYAFFDCGQAESVVMGKGVESIGDNAFSVYSGYPYLHSSNLKRVYIKDLTSWLNVELSSYTSNPITYAGTFYLNGKLVTDLEIPEGVTNIKPGVFINCTCLKSVKIPGSIESIGDDAFYGCTGLKGVYINDLEKWCKISFSAEESNPLTYAQKLYLNNSLITEMTLPNSTTEVKDYAFSGCKSLNYIKFGENVSDISSTAFKDCTGINTVCLYTKAIASTQNIVSQMPSGSRLIAYSTADAQTYCDIYGVKLVPFESPKCAEGVHIDYEKVTKNPTCTALGTKKQTCVFCGRINTVSVPKIAHRAGTAVTENKRKASCTKGLYDSVVYCVNCGTELSRTTKEYAIVSHTPGKPVVKKATVKDSGVVKTYCKQCGKLLSQETVDRISEYWLNNYEYTYNGKNKKPKVIVYSKFTKLVEGKDFTVTYPKNTAIPNEYKVKITMKGNFSGSFTDKFWVYPKPTKITKLKAGKGKITVRWKKGPQPCDGYYIEYSTSKSFKHSKEIYITGRSKTKKVIKGLKKGKKYYIRVWTGKNKCYNYSKKKSVRTLK